MEGKVALVTGVGSGIGRATTLASAREGATGVLVADRDEAGGEETVQMVGEATPEADVVLNGSDSSAAADVTGSCSCLSRHTVGVRALDLNPQYQV